MRRLLIAALLLPFLSWMAWAQDQSKGHSPSITINDGSANDDCRDHLRMSDSDYRTTVRDEETKTIPNQPLKITAEHNGGIQVTSWDKAEISLKLCKEIAVDDESEGRKLLAETRLEINGSNVSVQAPDGDRHSVATVLLVKAPKNADFNLNVHNGGVSLTSFTGTAEAHAVNGGISFKKSTGKLTAVAKNGGISIKDCGGDVNAEVQNGGLSITLPERWEGKGLEAHTRNGGLVVAVPRNFAGGLEVAASEYTSIICKDDVCGNAERTWDNGHKIFRLGGTSPQVHATTENGGIVIKEREHTRAEM